MITRIVTRFIPFLAAFVASLFLVTVINSVWVTPPPSQSQNSGNGPQGSGTGPASEWSPIETPRVTSPLRITAKPKAAYTDEARTNEVEGSVRLKVTLLASGEVGSMTVVNSLPDGLTEQAIAAARQIKFDPATVNGVPVSKTITIDYSFEIY